jgi:hypothetical protein
MSKSSTKTLDLNFPDGFDTTTASPKDYFDLMSDANIMTDFVRLLKKDIFDKGIC